MSFSIKDIEKEILAPGDIFWKKISGTNLLLSRKGDVINFDLIKKIDNGQNVIAIENGIDLHVHYEMLAVYEKYREEILIKEKLQWRERLISLLRSEFLEKRKEQFELNALALKLFSDLSREEILKLNERDFDLFQRHLSIAGTYTFCAFFLGYYDSHFLKNLFTETLVGLMDLGKNVNVLTLKEKLEYLRLAERFDEKDIDLVKEIGSSKIISETVVFEKYNGSGVRQVNYKEMTDLELVLISLISAFGVNEGTKYNGICMIDANLLKCDRKILRLIQRVLIKQENERMTGT